MSKFNTSNAANSIVNIIQTSIGNAAFDTTIRAIVQEKVDEATGKFKLQYQDGLFYAFADDVKVNYSKGTEVFVLVPKNDFTQDKRIIGSVKTLGENYAKVYSEDERYRKIGASAFGEKNGTFGIKSKSTNSVEESLVLYSAKKVAPLDSYFDNNFLNYLQQEGVDGIWLEATFTTDNLEWVENANYGLTVKFNLQDTDKTLDLDIDANNMVGNPFSLYNERQIVVFGLSAEATIDFSHITGIKSVSLWSEGFTTPVDENNIFVKDIKMYAVSAISETQLDAPNAEIWTKNGTYIEEDQGVPLQAQLKIKGKVQTDVKYFWFEEDLSINKDSGADYHVYGGRGWKLLNTTTPNGDGTFKIEETDKNILWVYDNTGSSAEAGILQTQLDIPKRLYKCVIAKSESERYEAIVEVTNSRISSYSYVIKRIVVKGEEIEYEDINSAVPLQENDEFRFAVVGNDDVLQTNVSWYKKDLFDTEWSPIDDDPDNEGQLKIAYASITTQKQIRAMVNGVMTQIVTLIAEAKIPDPTPQYQLVIVNTDQTFIYDENGRSPTHPAKTFKENAPKLLSFKLYDTYAKDTDPDITNQVTTSPVWSINSEGLINLSYSDYDADDATKGQEEYKYQFTGYQCNFTLKDAWSYDTVDNQITLTVKYADATITAKTNFTFLKQGDPGTNGTDVAIVVTGTPNLNNDGTYKDGLIVTKYIGSEAIPLDDITPQEITYKKGEVTVKTGVYKATIKEGDKVYYGYYIPPIAIEDTDTYQLVGKPSQYVVYDADGSNPKYADFQFKEQSADGNWVSIEVTFNGASSLRAVIPETFNSDLAASEGVFQIPVYDGTTLITTITLYASLNRHAFSMVNNWDGNLKIDNGNNYMLAATVAAGKKNEDNTFTGVMIGTIGDSTNSQHNKTGFFGFNQGVQTVFINAKDGSAKFGASSTAGFEWSLDPDPENGDDSYLSFNIIKSDKTSKNLLKVSKSEYYLQSADYEDGNDKYAIIYPKDGIRVESTQYSKSLSGNKYSIYYDGKYYSYETGYTEYSVNNEILDGTSSTKGRYAIIKKYTTPESIRVNIEDATEEKELTITTDNKTQKYLYYNGEYYVNYNIYSSSGLKIDVEKGTITSPAFSFTQGGDAVFKGRVEATSGSFSNAVYIGGRSVESMLTSLDSKVSAAIAQGYANTALKQANQYTADQINSLNIPVLPDYITETEITATTIQSPTIVGGTIIGGTFQAVTNNGEGKVEDIFTMTFVKYEDDVYYAQLASSWAPMMITTTLQPIILTTGSKITLDAYDGVYLGDYRIYIET